MREIFLALVAINILVLGGQLYWLGGADADAAHRAERSEGHELLLLSERGGGGAVVRESLAPTTTEPESEGEQSLTVGEAPFCILVGPFERLLRAEQFSEHLETLDIVSEVQELEVPSEVHYWIYLSPKSSREEALARLRQLQREGIDSYLVVQGAHTNGISLGLYTRQDLARNRLRDLREQGHDAKLEEIVRYRSENWVVMALDQADKVDGALWVELLNRAPGAEKQQKFCPGVASAPSFL